MEKYIIYIYYIFMEKYKLNYISKDINKLEYIYGWYWNFDVQWLEVYNLVKEYYQKYQKLPSQSCRYKDKKIGELMQTIENGRK